MNRPACVSTSLLLLFLPLAVHAAPRTSQHPVLVKHGNIIVKVSDFEDARTRVMDLAKEHRAELREADVQVNDQGKKHGSMTLQLGSAELVPMMTGLRRVGKLYSESVQTADRTSYYEKLGQRMTLLGRNEQELLSFLRSPRRMRGSDILFVQYRLYQSRTEAADASQERVDLDRAAEQSLLSVMLFEPEPEQAFDWGNWHAHAVYRAKSAFLTVVRKVTTGAYIVAWFAVFWVPAALILFFGGRSLWRRGRSWWERRQA